MAAPQSAVSKDELVALQNGVFPFVPLLVCIALAAVYAHTAHFVVIGPVIPIIKALGMAALVVYFLLGAQKNAPFF